ncbi:MAG: UPF0149 family protein [Burkholderiales bacterium]|nr:UPF0149 family protein [Burkholderiales bacterium]
MIRTHQQPLSDRDVELLDQILTRIPDDRNPLDVAMLDGYLVGVLLQPEVVLPSAWLPRVFDADGTEGALPDPEEARRAGELVMRRYNELAACIAAREAFDPIVFEFEDASGAPVTGRDALIALAPWAGGFVNALNTFPALSTLAEHDDDVAALLFAILRHLPIDPDAAQAERDELAHAQAELDAEAPLHDLDEAIGDLVDNILDIAEITRPNRPVTRSAPKVGRNDPCPCGSGRKYKSCHGREAG